MRKRIIIKSKTRFIIFLVVSIFLFMMLFLKLPATYAESYANQSVSVTVKKGDTLWTLASKYVSRKMDIRDYIQKVSIYNKLNNADIRPGQTIKFPLEY